MRKLWRKSKGQGLYFKATMTVDYDVRQSFQLKSLFREERREIVAKYDRGREDGAVIDDWEDPKFDVYHKKDRYGFIHDHRLPEIVSRY